jgi:hypothetical protein
MPLFQYNPKRRLLAALLIALFATGVCAAIFWAAPVRPRHDLVAELKALPVYPNASAPSFDDDANQLLHKSPPVGPTGSSLRVRPRPETWSAGAAMTYTTDATPEIVQAFYSDALEARGWDAAARIMPDYVYTQWDSRFAGLAFKVFQGWSPGAPIFELRRIETSRILTIKTVQHRHDSDASSKIIRVEIRLQITDFVW